MMQESRWASGFVVFAAIMLIMTGTFQALNGLVAIFEDQFYIVTPNYLFEFDVTAWGWVHLIIGIIVATAGVFVLQGRTWAIIVGITVAVLSAIANFMYIPYYPVWSLLIIALDVVVLWALVVHGREVAV
jgi:hypothetical protein